MLNHAQTVAEHVNRNRVRYAAAAATITGVAAVAKRAKLWTLFLTDPEQFEQLYPAAQ
jgi:hypothetical protein